jgi:hypothetical protein
LKASSRPLVPVGVPGGNPSRESSRSCSGLGEETSPATAWAAAPSGEEPRAPHETLSAPQSREDEVRGPGDLVAGQRQYEAAGDLPEGVGVEADRHNRRRLAPRLGLGGISGRDPRHRRRLLGVAVAVGELGQRVALGRPGGDLPVHGGEVLALPALGKAPGCRQLVATAPDCGDEECDDHEQGDRNGSGEKSAAAFRLGTDRAQADRKLVPR